MTTSDGRIGLLSELKPGDHIKYDCVLTTDFKKKSLNAMHHALVVSVNNSYQVTVIHNDGEIVKEEEISLNPNNVFRVKYKYPVKSGREAIERARTQLGASYNLFTGNCEHFVTWALTGNPVSMQVMYGFLVAGTGLVGGATAGAVIGSIVPVIGNVIGAVGGGVLGTIGGVSLYFSKW